MNEAKEQFLVSLQGILNQYPVAAMSGGLPEHLNKRKNLQFLFRQEQQYRLGALLNKWSENDPEISNNDMAKIYFQCVFRHFKTIEYHK